MLRGFLGERHLSENFCRPGPELRSQRGVPTASVSTTAATTASVSTTAANSDWSKWATSCKMHDQSEKFDLHPPDLRQP